MATYNGRHGPNVSQYLRDLNMVTPQESNAEEPFAMENDLSLFTNTQFFDFDSGENTDFQAQPVKMEGKPVAQTPRSSAASDDTTAPPSVIGDMPNLDFISNEFNFSDFNNAYAAPPMNNFADGTQNFQPHPANHAGAVQVPSAQYGQDGDKLKAEAMNGAGRGMHFEEVSRKAAEEEKRKRNTAASARFRIKKKQREQALEKSAKEMTDKVTGLENKVSQLETENKWLKNLLVEKNEGSEDISALWKEFTKQASQKLRPGVDSAKAER